MFAIAGSAEFALPMFASINQLVPTSNNIKFLDTDTKNLWNFSETDSF